MPQNRVKRGWAVWILLVSFQHMNRLFIYIVACLFACASFAEEGKVWTPEMIGQGAFNLSPDQALVYKTVDKQGEASELQLQVFLPKGHQSSDCRPAAVFFHGGGWYGGTPDHMYPQCRYLALRGMVAISVQYRTINVFGTTPKECVKDGKSAMRWVRSHAAELGINPSRIVAGGGSAGGHIAAATALVEAFDEAGEDASVSCRPDALVLLTPSLITARRVSGIPWCVSTGKQFPQSITSMPTRRPRLLFSAQRINIFRSKPPSALNG